MNIYVYDKQTLELEDVLPHNNSIIVRKNWCDVGSIEISSKSLIDTTGNIIVTPYTAGIIVDVVDNNAVQKIVCYDLKGITCQRYIEEEINIANQTADSVLCYMAVKFFKTAERNVDKLRVIQRDGSNGMMVDNYTFEKGTMLNDALKNFCEQYNIGYDVTFDGEYLYFEIIPESDNTDTIFSKNHHSISDIEHSISQRDYKNCIYDEVGSIVHSEGDNGLMRFEGNIDEGTTIADYLNEHRKTETITATPNSKYQYGNDYKIGDLVTVIDGDIITEKHICEVQIGVEFGKKEIIASLGDAKQNPLKKILRR